MEYEFQGHTYQFTKLGLGDSKECLLRLLKLNLITEDGLSLEKLGQNLSVSDLAFFEQKLFGAHLHLQNDTGNWVPLGKAIVDNHFNGRLGVYFHLLAKAIIYNYADFLADLHIDELLGQAEAAA